MVSHSFAQVVVDGNTNNIAIQEIRLNVDGNAHLQTTDLASRYNPAPDNVPVLIETILLQNGTEIFATTRTPEIQNLHPYLGTNTIGENTVGVAKYDGTYVNHQNAGFANALEEVVSTPDLRSYWDIGSNAIPTGQVFMDIMYPIEVPKSGYLVVSERDGNSDFDFQAFEENDGFRIKWRTAKEKNNKKYQIWRSSFPELKEFKLVGELQGIGESSAPTKYSFLDTVPCHQESVYYRIVQWDHDGNYSSSDIFKLKREEKDSRNMRIFPNPYFGGELQISLSKGILQKNGFVSIQDNTGQYLFYKEGKIKNWADMIPSRLKDLPVGLYFVMIMTNEEKNLVKWIKK
ncbi:MAG: T9SS type A sorting domain-containing protein [Cyclobacteriaceae bacterium]